MVVSSEEDLHCSIAWIIVNMTIYSFKLKYSLIDLLLASALDSVIFHFIIIIGSLFTSVDLKF